MEPTCVHFVERVISLKGWNSFLLAFQTITPIKLQNAARAISLAAEYTLPGVLYSSGRKVCTNDVKKTKTLMFLAKEMARRSQQKPFSLRQEPL